MSPQVIVKAAERTLSQEIAEGVPRGIFSAPTQAEPHDEPAASGTCARCGHHTNNGTAHWVTRDSAPDVRLIVHTDQSQCTT